MPSACPKVQRAVASESRHHRRDRGDFRAESAIVIGAVGKAVGCAGSCGFKRHAMWLRPFAGVDAGKIGLEQAGPNAAKTDCGIHGCAVRKERPAFGRTLAPGFRIGFGLDQEQEGGGGKGYHALSPSLRCHGL